MPITTKIEIDPEILRKYIQYDPISGLLKRVKLTKGCRTAGWFSGTSSGKKKYLDVQVVGIRYRVHRLVWALHYGVWPSEFIDHKDGDVTNNKIDNLRDVSLNLNQQNRKVEKRNISGTTGVRWISRDSKWVAGITVKGRYVHLGVFDSLTDAVTARKQAEIKYNHKNHRK